jgi:uncharacterized protein (DUF58 family)
LLLLYLPRSRVVVPILRKVAESYREFLTPRGRYLLWLTGALAVLGLNTRENQVFKVFAVAAALLIVAFVFAVLRAPKARLGFRLPLRATALRPLALRAQVEGHRPGFSGPLLLSFPKPRRWGSSIVFEPRQALVDGGRNGSTETSITFKALRRGKYILRGPSLRATDPLALVGGRARRLPDQAMLVYPRFYTMEDFFVPAGRRYQPGGIPLASSTADSVEFMGTREYRQGDAVKHIHWRSWARVGEPVVKEFQEEYFCRIAVILDTFVPRRAAESDVDGFESAISVVASIADFFSRSEYVVDIFAAGPDIYEVSAGRSLAYLENILDVLACLEPCGEPPFEVVGPALFGKLSMITSVVAVLQDWDDAREDFLRQVKMAGVELRVMVVKEGETTKPVHAAGDELGEFTLMSPTDVERAIHVAEAAR